MRCFSSGGFCGALELFVCLWVRLGSRDELLGSSREQVLSHWDLLGGTGEVRHIMGTNNTCL